MSMPHKDSKNYRSAIGLLDTRVDLVMNHKPNTTGYNAALSTIAAKLAYENQLFVENVVKEHWNMVFLEYYNCWSDFVDQVCTHAFMMCDQQPNVELIVIAFKGIDPFDAVQWCTDMDFSFYKIPDLGSIHGGFLKALGLQRDKRLPKHIDGSKKNRFAYYVIREKLRCILHENRNAKFIVTGHSLGGALVILFPIVLAYHEEEFILGRMEGVYTFGQPWVGDEMLGKIVETNIDKPKRRYYRFVYCNDMVLRVPCHDDTNVVQALWKVPLLQQPVSRKGSKGRAEQKLLLCVGDYSQTYKCTVGIGAELSDLVCERKRVQRRMDTEIATIVRTYNPRVTSTYSTGLCECNEIRKPNVV